MAYFTVLLLAASAAVAILARKRVKTISEDVGNVTFCITEKLEYCYFWKSNLFIKDGITDAIRMRFPVDPKLFIDPLPRPTIDGRILAIETPLDLRADSRSLASFDCATGVRQTIIPRLGDRMVLSNDLSKVAVFDAESESIRCFSSQSANDIRSVFELKAPKCTGLFAIPGDGTSEPLAMSCRTGDMIQVLGTNSRIIKEIHVDGSILDIYWPRRSTALLIIGGRACLLDPLHPAESRLHDIDIGKPDGIGVLDTSRDGRFVLLVTSRDYNVKYAVVDLDRREVCFWIAGGEDAFNRISFGCGKGELFIYHSRKGSAGITRCEFR